MKAIRTTVPEPLDPVPFNLAPAFRTTLANGLRVVVVDDERVPLVSYRMAFLSGNANEPKDMTGVTSAMTSLITEGTDSYSSRELAEKIERLGGSLSASSSEDFTMVAGSALTMYSSDILHLMADVMFSPTFPENEVELFKRNTIENLKFQRSQPGFLAGEQTARLMFGQHPYGKYSPTPADVEKLTQESLEAARRHTFLPNDAIFVAVGDVRKDELLLEIDELFGDWDAGDRDVHEFPKIQERSDRTLTIVDRPGSAQANIVLSNHCIPRHHPDYFPLLVMNQVLGAGASSRVFMNLREEKGYTYGAYTRLDLKKLAGTLDATSEVRTAVTGDSLKEFFYELERIRDEEVLQGELDDAKNFLTGVFPIRAETQEGLTNLIVNQELYGLPHDYLDRYRDEVDAVSADEVRRVAAEYIKPDKIAMVIVGDAMEILPQVREYAANIELFDKEGNQKDMNEYEMKADAAPENVGGTWSLELDFQGQPVPITLSLDQNGEGVTGKLTTMLGDGEITEGSVSGNRVSAKAVTEIQGQSVDFVIGGVVDGDSISGTISAAIIPDSLEFKGTRDV
jgi:zinc protease